MNISCIFFFLSIVFCSDLLLNSSSTSSLISSDQKKDKKSFLDLKKDQFFYISKFLPVPQRELKRLNKSTCEILTEIPFHNLIADRFQIFELHSTTRDDDLIWFEDKYECFANNFDQFFFFLWHAISIANKFSFNERLLCQYFLRIYESKKQIYDPIFINELKLNALTEFVSFFAKREYYDLLLPILLKHLNLYSENYDFFKFGFYQEFIISNFEINGLNNFFLIFDSQQDISKKSILMSNLLLTEKAESIFSKSLKRVQIINGNISEFIKCTFYFIFSKISDSKFSIPHLNYQGINRIFKQNLRILSLNSNYIDDFEFENFKNLNQIYFGSEIDKSNAVEYIEEYIKSVFYLDKHELFLTLLQSYPELCYNWIREHLYIFKNNFAFFFIFSELFPEWNCDVDSYYLLYIYKKFFKLYNFKDFRIGIDNSCNLVLELKKEFLHLTEKKYPLMFIHKYKENFIKDSLIYLIFGTFEGSGIEAEEAFIQLIQFFGENYDKPIHYELFSDDFFKLLSTSERMRNLLFDVNIITWINVNLDQLLRLLNNKVQLVHNSFKFKIALKFNEFSFDFDNFKNDKHFENFEEFTGNSILVNIKPIIKFYYRETLARYFQVRNGLMYLLKRGRYSELLELDNIILSYLEKETGKNIQSLYDATISLKMNLFK